MKRSARPMGRMISLPTAETPGRGFLDPLLFTPGPLTTSYGTKAAMLRDFGSRDQEFIKIVGDVRSGLLDVAGVSDKEFSAIPMQGSGSYCVEATVTSVVPRNGRLLVVSNGAYGDRIAKMCSHAGIKHSVLRYEENQRPQADDVERSLRQEPGTTHVALIHSETTSGIINPINDIGKVVQGHGASLIVDAMSSFGAVPIDVNEGHIDYIVSSANKCIEGVPGFAFVIARNRCLDATEGNARSLSLDIHQQNKGLNANGQFRFTPPTHSILAFRQALRELRQEGGVHGRARRYLSNRDICRNGLVKLGFEPYLSLDLSGYIITSFRYPNHPSWDFEEFYSRLSSMGMLLYPGKVTNADCFRVGHIGRLFPEDSRELVKAVRHVSEEMGIF